MNVIRSWLSKGSSSQSSPKIEPSERPQELSWKEARIGVDVGGVVITRSSRWTAWGDDTSFFGGNFKATPPMPGSFAGIRTIVERAGPEKVFIISKAGKEIQDKTLAWMDANEFWKETGMLKENVHFCLKKSEKLPIAEQLGLHVFVDDYLDVLDFVIQAPTMKRGFWLEPDHKVAESVGEIHGLYTHAKHWDGIVSHLHEWLGDGSADDAQKETKEEGDS